MTATIEDMPTLAEVRTLLSKRPRDLTLDEIAVKCAVSVPWLKKVAKGHIKNPSYDRIVAIYRFVKSKIVETVE